MLKLLECNVTLMVTDMDKAIEFYTGILGFKLKNRYGDHWAGIEGPNLSIGLHPMGDKIRAGDNFQIALRVENLDKAISELSIKGIHFKIQDDTQLKLAFFNDPDGNVLYLTQTPG